VADSRQKREHSSFPGVWDDLNDTAERHGKTVDLARLRLSDRCTGSGPGQQNALVKLSMCETSEQANLRNGPMIQNFPCSVIPALTAHCYPYKEHRLT
jgi:hypothetical protein